MPEIIQKGATLAIKKLASLLVAKTKNHAGGRSLGITRGNYTEWNTTWGHAG